MIKIFRNHLISGDFFYFLYKQSIMILYVITFIKIFIFILSFLEILRELFNVFKIIKMRSGKIELNGWRLAFLYFSISYIITILIVGF